MSTVTWCTRSVPAGPTSVRFCAENTTRPGLDAVRGGTFRASVVPIMASANTLSDASVAAKLATVRPCLNTVIWSAIPSASRSLCVMSTTAPSFAANVRNTRPSSSLSSGVSTAVGSSRMRMRASRARAFRISSRCCAPTGRASTGASGSIVSPVVLASACTRLRAPAGWKRPRPPSATFSATVIRGMVVKCWCTMPIPRAIAWAGERGQPSCPCVDICPASGGIMPKAMRMSVVLPAPFSPRSAWTVPGSTVSAAPFSAQSDPKYLVTPERCNAGGRVLTVR